MIYHGNTEIASEMVMKVSVGYLGDHNLGSNRNIQSIKSESCCQKFQCTLFY